MAVPSKPGLWSTITLSDGTQVLVQRVGDEHMHWFQAADGTCYSIDGDKYVKAEEEVLETMRQSRIATRAARRAITSSTTDGLGKKGKMSMGSCPSIGEFTIPVVMVQFKDTKFKASTTVAKMTRMYNEEGYHDESGTAGSVRDYFKAQSGGQFVPTFDVVGIVTLDTVAAYYGTNDSYGNDKNLDKLPLHVTKAAKEQLGIDFSKYVVPAGDSNHKKGVPLLAMLYAGKGEATEQESTANSKLLWPCEWDDVEDSYGGNYDGVHFNSFFIGNELLGNRLMGMSVFCHEFGHALGLPDFYCTDYNYGNDDGFGYWSIMDAGAYVNSECRFPMGYTAYEKSYLGWLDMKEIGNADTITLQSPLGLAEGSAYIIRNSSTETFIFENRQTGTWYPSSFGNGVLVTRIAYSSSYWKQNIVNNTQSKKRACILTADGSKITSYARSSHLYGNGKNAIESLKTLSGTSKNIDVKKIVKNGDGTISLIFKVADTPLPQDTTQVNIPVAKGDVIFYESFDQCMGRGGNDAIWSGNAGNGTIVYDNEGWEATAGKGADECGKFGISSMAGSATTPTIVLNGQAVLSFRAAAWNTIVDDTQMVLSAQGGTVAPTYITLPKGEWGDFKANVTGTGSVRITFSTANRFFLDEVKLQLVEGTNAIESIASQSSVHDDIYDLSGRRIVGKPRKGLYIVNGRKVLMK